MNAKYRIVYLKQLKGQNVSRRLLIRRSLSCHVSYWQNYKFQWQQGSGLLARINFKLFEINCKDIENRSLKFTDKFILFRLSCKNIYIYIFCKNVFQINFKNFYLLFFFLLKLMSCHFNRSYLIIKLYHCDCKSCNRIIVHFISWSKIKNKIL